MIKKDALKYHYYGEDMPEVLFDLENNPEETINFIDDKNYSEMVSYFRNRRSTYLF